MKRERIVKHVKFNTLYAVISPFNVLKKHMVSRSNFFYNWLLFEILELETNDIIIHNLYDFEETLMEIIRIEVGRSF